MLFIFYILNFISFHKFRQIVLLSEFLKTRDYDFFRYPHLA